MMFLDFQGFKELKKIIGKNIEWWKWVDTEEEKPDVSL